MAEKFIYTKYEKARIIGSRALQISMGAPFAIKLDQDDLAKINYNPVEIAKMEFEKGLVPIFPKRRMPQPRRVDEKKATIEQER